MAESQDLKLLLLETNDEFRELASTHQALDSRIRELEIKPYLTADEQLEESRLKKRKLQMKDRMEVILREYRNQSRSSVSA
jgi:hypothetical protein